MAALVDIITIAVFLGFLIWYVINHMLPSFF